jgi:exodeoxyribonuclease VII large subunit
VQGERCAVEVAAAIRGFNALPPDGPIPRPDVLIVARGGGSVEDLWGFNEEIVVRAAADSAIPLISAVGHETDTTLIDFAADLRAPTPTAAAELAVPVRADLVAAVAVLDARLARAVRTGLEVRGQRLRDLGRALPRPEALIIGPSQRLDLAAGRLAAGLRAAADRKALALGRAAGGLRPAALRALAAMRAQTLAATAARLQPALAARIAQRRERLAALRLGPETLRLRIAREAPRPAELFARAAAALARQLERAAERLAALDRQRRALGFEATLARGFALIRGPDGAPVTRSEALRATPRFTVRLADGETEAAPLAGPRPLARRPARDGGPGGQGSLF